MAKLSDFEMEHGLIDDSNGDRYYLFYLYFLLNDKKSSAEFIRWYEKKFPNDIGEPFQLLCWTLIVHRMGLEADRLLARTMLSNIYLIPRLLGQPSSGSNTWHAVTFGEIEYLDSLPKEIIAAINDDDRYWIREKYNSDLLQGILAQYIDIENELKNLPVGDKRSKLVYNSHHLVDRLEKVSL
jgi:hypothetical protein